MKKSILTVLFLMTLCVAFAQPKPYTVQPTYADVKYGEHPRNVFDLWLAESDVPTPVVIFVHGGGFCGGSKEQLNMGHLKRFLNNGISVVSVNYRYCKGLEDGALASIRDVARAVQFVRHHWKEWNIDKERVGMYGSSAGAGTTIWIACHDDLAKPKSKDRIARESTRVNVAACIAVQSTYDVFQWPEMFNLPETDPLIKTLYQWGVSWLGLKSIKDKDTPHGLQMRNELDLISLITPDDPPFYLINEAPAETAKFGQFVHHPLFAKQLYDKGRACGIDCQAYAPALPESGLNERIDIINFLIKYLN